MRRLSVLFFSIVLVPSAIEALWPTLATAETVIVKYRGPVDLSPFACETITRSSVIKRLCYDSHEQYVIVNLTGSYYHYCEVSQDIVTAWRKADSMGKFYDAQIKGRFDCRVLHVPAYGK